MRRFALTLDEALVRARQNSPQFQAALGEAQIAQEDSKQAKDALLPSVAYNNQVLYTQGNGTGGVRYIANNAVHEYISQGNVHEALDVAGIYAVRRAAAAAAVARARAEIASRGLVVTVVQNYFAALAAQRKADLAQKAADEGDTVLAANEKSRKWWRSGACGRDQGGIASAGAPAPASGGATDFAERAAGSGGAAFSGF